MSAIRNSAAVLGYDMAKSIHFREYLLNTGLVDVHEYRIPLPLSPWPRQSYFRQLGSFGAAAWPIAMDSYRKIMLDAGMNPVAVAGLEAESNRDVTRRDIHPYIFV
jgi:hypothetical protein